jgi:tRNA-specific 2-thiouridylase
LDDGGRDGARILLAMSGGVDSGVAAVKLKDEGYEVIGLTMKNYCYGDVAVPDKSCCSLEAIDDARGVCDRFGIRHMVVSTEEIFGREVYDDFISEYARGRTPNPCVRCNSIVRFSTLIEYARRLDIDYIATGHYARIFRSSNDRLYLARSKHLAKDQSYFLSGLKHDDLTRVVFPLGDYEKEEVREAARSAELDIADKPESMEVCFMPDGTLGEFLEGKVPVSPGDVENTNGEVLGRHKGLAMYTVGQRRGFGISAPNPLYVIRLDIDRNVLIVGTVDELATHDLNCNLNWIDDAAAENPNSLKAQIRYRQSGQEVDRLSVNDGVAHVHFSQPQRAIAPGQTVAFYDGDVVVGSGVIDNPAATG